MWIDLFEMCFEWRFDGGQVTRGKKTVKTGYWGRVEWPDPGGALKQASVVVDILDTIQAEKMKMFYQGF